MKVTKEEVFIFCMGAGLVVCIWIVSSLMPSNYDLTRAREWEKFNDDMTKTMIENCVAKQGGIVVRNGWGQIVECVKIREGK